MPRASARTTASARSTPLSEVDLRNSQVCAVANRARCDLAGEAVPDAKGAALRKAAQGLKFRTHAPVLNRALDAVNREDYDLGAKLGMKVLARDAELGLAWHVLGICREKAGDWAWALRCYQSAFDLMPGQTDIAHDLGRLAQNMGQTRLAEQFYRVRIAAGGKDYLDSVNNLALLQKDEMRHGEAIETLRPYLQQHPNCMLLWNSLAGVVFDQGDLENALLFFNEALKLNPDFSPALYNRSNVRSALGDKTGALADVDRAILTSLSPTQRVQFELGRAFRRLDAGDLSGGWDAYEARLDPIYASNDVYEIPLPHWSPAADLAGKRLLVVAEQGLGDEVMFANLLDDVICALEPTGSMTLAVEPRLVSLFARSWPTVEVTTHRTVASKGRTLRYVPDLAGFEPHDLWAPMASLLRRFRRTLGSFPSSGGYLIADPTRARHWRDMLDSAGPGPKIGVVWKSIKISSDRKRIYAPFPAWEPILRTSGVTFVDLQYGAHEEDLAFALERFGVKIWSPPGLDLKDDLEGVTALASVLDLTIGPANAATNLAAAAGAPVWMITTQGAWTKLGTDRYPWYPSARVFTPDGVDAWAPVMREVATALGAEVVLPFERRAAAGG